MLNTIKPIEDYRIELQVIEGKIKRLEPTDSHVDSVSRSFHLGMVGGSGKNTYRLNKRREAYLDRTIKAAKILTELYSRRDWLKSQIEKIESGYYEKQAQKKKSRDELLVELWKRLKVGDELPIGNPNGNPIITKKNAKSCETGSGCKWTASEIIGKDAAKLLNQ